MSATDESSDLAKVGTRGAVATLSGQGLKAALQFLSIITLARILSPTEFGDVAVVMAVIGVASILTDFGLSLAAVQARTLSEGEKNTLYWVNVLLGLICTFLILLLATPVGHLYGLSRIVPIAEALSVVFLLSSAAVQHRVQLIRSGRFGMLAIGEVISQLLGLIAAVSIALAGGGVWSLVAQQILAAAVAWTFMWKASKWTPGQPWRLVSIRRFMSYSFGTVGTQVLNYASVNVPSIVVGRSLGPADAGIYNRAYQLFVAPMQQLASPLTRVALALLSRSWGSSQFVNQVLALQRLLVYSLGIFLAYVLVNANPIVGVLLGPTWSQVGPILSILCFGGIFQVVGYAYYWAFLASGRTRILLWCEVPGRIVMIVGVAALAGLGLHSIAWCITAGLAIISLSSAIFGLPRIGISFRQIANSMWRPCLIILLCTVTCLILVNPIHLASFIGVGARTSVFAVFFALSLSLKGYRSDYNSIVQLFARARSHSKANE